MIIPTMRPARIAALIRMIKVDARNDMMNMKGSVKKKEAIRTKIPKSTKKQAQMVIRIRMSQNCNPGPGESVIVPDLLCCAEDRLLRPGYSVRQGRVFLVPSQPG